MCQSQLLVHNSFNVGARAVVRDHRAPPEKPTLMGLLVSDLCVHAEVSSLCVYFRRLCGEDLLPLP